MSEEEKQVIEDIKERVEEYEHYDMATLFTKDVRKLFEIIDKQQKEIEEKCKKYVDLCFEAGKTKADLDIAERVIDKMAEELGKIGVFKHSKEQIKEYFYKEIENE